MVELKEAAWKCTKCGVVYNIKQKGGELCIPAFCECGARPKDFVIVWNKSKWEEK